MSYSHLTVGNVVIHPLDYDLTKHVILYNWTALSLIRRTERDVAMVAAYGKKDCVTIYWTKNRIDEADREQAKELTVLVKGVTKGIVNLGELQKCIFQIDDKNWQTKTQAKSFKI
jgi:hypothetical protein